MKRYPIQIFAALALAAFAATAAVSCGNRGGSGKNQQDSSSAGVAQAQAAAVPDTIAPLVPGEVRLKDDVFGGEIALKGDTVKRDEIFQVGVSTMIVKDSLMLVCCRDDRPEIFQVGVSTMIVKDSLMLVCCRDDRPFRMYSLPGLELRGVSGNRGRGPMEFISPDIWPYEAPGYMALVMDESRDYRKMYKVRTDGTLEQLNHRIPGQYLADFSYTRGVAAEDDGHIAFAYRSAIYLYDGSDTAAAPEQTVRKLADVRLGKYSAGSTMNIGSLGVNFQYERAVWAFKYAKRVVFCDFDGNMRSVDFRSAEEGETEGVGMDSNVTHYWKLYAGHRSAAAHRWMWSGSRIRTSTTSTWSSSTGTAIRSAVTASTTGASSPWTRTAALFTSSLT